MSNPGLRRLQLIATLLTLAALASCGPGAPGAARPAQVVPESEQLTPTGTLKIIWSIEPENLHSKLGAGGPFSEYHWVFNSVLVYHDLDGRAHPMLAREIPSQEKGDWVINPDATMVTTYRLRENARWHDGNPVTAQDYVFAFQVYMDPDVPVRERVPESLIAKVEASDDHTVVISWRQSFVGANTLGYQQLDALPRHVFEEKYRSNKAALLLGEDWTSSYIGNGPFQMERWTPGVGMTARANAGWVLGPPRLEALDIRFGSDPNTTLANILAGEVDLVSTPAIRTSEAAVAREQLVSRGEAYVKSWHRSVRLMQFQYREVPNWQRAVTDLRVRRALVHAMDRQALADTLTHGLGFPLDAFINPADPFFPDVDGAITKYPFDPARALALLNEAGWRGSAGGLLTNAAGSTLDVEIWNSQEGGTERESILVVDTWKAVGINASIYMIPAARDRDHEHRASFPAVTMNGRGLPLENFAYTSSNLPTPALRWQSPNRGSFQDPEVDRLHVLGMTLLNESERRQAVIALHQRVSDLLAIALLYSNPSVFVAKRRVQGPVGEGPTVAGLSWNIYEWRLTD